MSVDEFLLSLALASRPDSAAVVRRALAQVLPAHGFGDDERADLALLASELVTNAVRHGRPGTITVKISSTAAHIRIEVTNPGRTFAPPSEPDAHHAAGGFGLPLVRQLSSRWGIESAAKAVTVWSEYTDRSAQQRAE